MMLKCFPFVFRPLTAYELFFKETQAAVRTNGTVFFKSVIIFDRKMLCKVYAVDLVFVTYFKL